MSVSLSFRCLLPALAFSLVAGAQTPLRSPWDLHPVKLTAAPYTCPADVHVPHDITLSDYYSDSKHSIIDPVRHEAYAQAAKPYQALMTATEAAADNFTRTGSRAAAACTTHLLAVAATEDAMTGAMSSNQAFYVQGWTLGGISIAMLKVRQAQPGSAADRAAISAWLLRIAHSTHDYFQGRMGKNSDGQNNHLYWAGLSVLAAGVVADDRPDYTWGIGTYRLGVDSILPDGTLSREMARGQRALHYHLFSLAPLVVLAEFGEANGEPLYTYRDSALKLLAARCVSGLQDPSFFVAKTGEPQVGDSQQPSAGDISWAVPYSRRFPDPALTSLIQSAKNLGDRYLGGLPPS